MLIAQITDTHLCLPAPEGTTRQQDLEQVVASINALDPSPDIAVHTGDIVHNGLEEEYVLARQILSKLMVPLFVIPGNKDARNLIKAHFGDAMGDMPPEGFITYAVRNYPVDLIFTDTLDEGGNKGRFCKLRRMRLKQMLEEGEGKSSVLFMHHPPFPVSGAPDPDQFANDEDRRRLETLLEGQSGLLGMICGHGHRTETTSFAGIAGHMQTAVARDLRKPNTPEIVSPPPVFALHHVSERGLMHEHRQA